MVLESADVERMLASYQQATPQERTAVATFRGEVAQVRGTPDQVRRLYDVIEKALVGLASSPQHAP